MFKKFYTIFIIFGAFIGLLITGIFIYNYQGEGYKYAIYGAGFGGLIGYLIAYVMVEYKKQGFVLMKKFQKLGDIKGRNINVITSAVGGYTSRKEVTITDRNNEKGWYYIFTDGAYSVQILVGADSKCHGISQETIDGKPVE